MSLPAAELSFFFGETWRRDFVCSGARATRPDAVITASTWRLAQAGAIVEQLTLGAGLTLSAPRTVSLLLAYAATAAFAAGLYRHELRVVFDDGTEQTEAAGNFVIRDSLFAP